MKQHTRNVPHSNSNSNNDNNQKIRIQNSGWYRVCEERVSGARACGGQLGSGDDFCWLFSATLRLASRNLYVSPQIKGSMFIAGVDTRQTAVAINTPVLLFLPKMLDGAVVLIVGSTTGLDFIILQLISTYCRVYVLGHQEETPAFERAKSRISCAHLHYLANDASSSDSESDADDNAHMNDMIAEFLRLESRLDLVIFSSVDNEEKVYLSLFAGSKLFTENLTVVSTSSLSTRSCRLSCQLPTATEAQTSLS